MPWTDPTQVLPWVKGLDLMLPGMGTALNAPIADAETLLRGRFVSFISPATVTAWTVLGNTPALVQLWNARMAAAYYYAETLGYLMTAVPPDNAASILYADVMAEIKRAEFRELIIVSTTGTIIPVGGPVTNTPYRDVDALPISAGGDTAI